MAYDTIAECAAAIRNDDGTMVHGEEMREPIAKGIELAAQTGADQQARGDIERINANISDMQDMYGMILDVVADGDADPTGHNTSDIEFKACLDYLNDAGGGVLKCPAGYYTFNDGIVVPSNVKIIGNGTVFFQLSANHNTNVLLCNKPDVDAGGYNAALNITIENINFAATNNFIGSLCYFVNARNIVVKNCGFGASPNNRIFDSHSIELVACGNVTISNCSFRGWFGGVNCEAVHIGAATGTEDGAYTTFKVDGTSCTSVAILDCNFSGRVLADFVGNPLAPAIGNHFAGNQQPFDPDTNRNGWRLHRDLKIERCRFLNEWFNPTFSSSELYTIMFKDAVCELLINDCEFIGSFANVNNKAMYAWKVYDQDVEYGAFMSNLNLINYSNTAPGADLNSVGKAYNIYIADASSSGVYDNLTNSWTAR